MSIQGLRHTSNFVTDQRPKNWREGILMLYPNGQTPLYALSSLMKERKVDDPEFAWWEKQLPAQRLKLGAAMIAGDTTFTLTNDVTGDGSMYLTTALQLKAGHLLRVEQTGEVVRVASNPSSATSISVTRAFGETAAAAVNIATAGVNPYLLVIGTAYEENSLAPTGINYDAGKQYNYTQIFRNTLEMSRTAQRTRLRTGDQMKEAKREALELHSIEMEKAFFWGERLETTTSSKPIRTTRGVNRWIRAAAATNVVDKAGAATDLETLEGWLEQMFRYGSSQKTAFCGNTALLTIGQIIRRNSSWTLDAGEEYKMKVTRLTTPFGELLLKPHPLFNQNQGGTTGGTAYYGNSSTMIVLDMANIHYTYVDDTKYDAEMRTPGQDGMIGGYLTECGLEVHHPLSHFIVTGLTNPAVDT